MRKNSLSTLWIKVEYGIISLIGLLLFLITSKITMETRGYFAIGGEVFILLLPFFWWIVTKFAIDTIDIFFDYTEDWFYRNTSDYTLDVDSIDFTVFACTFDIQDAATENITLVGTSKTLNSDGTEKVGLLVQEGVAKTFTTTANCDAFFPYECKTNYLLIKKEVKKRRNQQEIGSEK